MLPRKFVRELFVGVETEALLNGHATIRSAGHLACLNVRGHASKAGKMPALRGSKDWQFIGRKEFDK